MFWCCWQAWHFERSGHAAELKISAEGGVGRLVWLPKELKDHIRPYWQKAKPYLAFGIECGKAFVQVIAAAYSIYIYGRIIQDSMHGIKDSLNWFKGLN